METENHNYPDQQRSGPNTLVVTSDIKNHLLTTAKWAKFIAIVGFIIILFHLIHAIALTTYDDLSPSPMVGPISIIRTYSGPFGMNYFVYVILRAALLFLPTLYLYQFSTNIKSALANEQFTDPESAFSKLKSFFKVCGIFVIIMLIAFVFTIINLILKLIY